MLNIKTENYLNIKKEAIGQVGLGFLTRILDTNAVKNFLGGTATGALTGALTNLSKDQLIDAPYIMKQTSDSLKQELYKIIENINSKSDIEKYPVLKEIYELFVHGGGYSGHLNPLEDKFKILVNKVISAFSGGQELYRDLIRREEYVGKLRDRRSLTKGLDIEEFAPTYSEKGQKYQDMLYKEVHSWLGKALTDLGNRIKWVK